VHHHRCWHHYHMIYDPGAVPLGLAMASPEQILHATHRLWVLARVLFPCAPRRQHRHKYAQSLRFHQKKTQSHSRYSQVISFSQAVSSPFVSFCPSFFRRHQSQVFYGYPRNRNPSVLLWLRLRRASFSDFSLAVYSGYQLPFLSTRSLLCSIHTQASPGTHTLQPSPRRRHHGPLPP